MSDLPPSVAAEVRRILRAEARRRVRELTSEAAADAMKLAADSAASKAA